MRYSFVCKKCNYHCHARSKEQRSELAGRHKVRRPDGSWACADLKINTKTKVMRRGQIVSAFED